MLTKRALAGVVLCCAQLLSGCNPLFVSRVIYEESRILLNRQDISVVAESEKTSATDRQKLKMVLAARDYATRIGLDPKESFTKFTQLDREILAWVLVGSKPDAFQLFTWWYPIVGSVPYKGYFERRDAERGASNLESIGYETWVRPTEAFSTLGWFNDPLLSTTLANNVSRITNTVLHESTHSTVWIPGSVDFNESLANFVGHTANQSFFDAYAASCPDQTCRTQAQQWLSEAQLDLVSTYNLSALIERLYSELDQLYRSAESQAEKLRKRAEIFESYISPLRLKNPGMRAFSKINNAEIMQLKLYLTRLEDFRAAFERGGGSWSLFFDTMRSIKRCLEDDAKLSAWELLTKAAASDDNELCRSAE